MQESVTWGRRKRYKKTGLKPVVFTVLFFVIIFLISAILVVSKRNNLCFEARRFYVVYSAKNKTEQMLLETQKKTSDMGGAGVILEKDNDFYVAVSVYNSKDDALEIAKTIKDTFAGAGVVELSSKAVARNVRNEIRQSHNYFLLYETIYNYLNEYQTNCFEYAKGNILEGKFMSGLVAKKLEFETLVENCKSENIEQFKAVLACVEEIIKNAKSVFDKFYTAKSKQSVCFEFLVKLDLEFVNLCKNLS